MRRSVAPTLQDVAKEAGVTAMTVSVVLNGARSATRVSDATSIRIKEAAVRLRYRPNAVARGLSRRRMDSIGVVAEFDGAELNLYFLEVFNGILEAAKAHDQNATFFSISSWERDEHRVLQFCDGRVDGMVFVAPKITHAFAESFLHMLPFVSLHGSDSALPAINLDVDNEGGAYRIVNHLIEQGHRRIAHFTGNGTGSASRQSGYRQALLDAGIEVDESLVVPGNYSEWSGRTLTESLLESTLKQDLPTAIFCASDAVAVGCMEVLANKGILVPEQISIAGFDDTLAARMTAPPLTTVRQPFRDMGKRAVELLLPQVHGSALQVSSDGHGADARPELFDVQVIKRGSVGPPRTSA